MGRVKLEIEYDSDAKTATVSVNGRDAHQFVDASLIFEADVDEHDSDGWLTRKVTGTRLIFSAGSANA